MSKTSATFLAFILTLGFATCANAQSSSNVLIVSQDASTKVITVIKVADPGTTGTWLSFSSQLSTTGSAVENSLYSGLASGKVLLIRQDVTSKTVTVLLVTDPGASGTFVSIDNSVTNSVGAIKNALYLGL
jgi:hypothetical protein